MRKIVCFAAVALVIPILLAGCKFGFQGSGGAVNSENTVSFVDDGSPQSVLYKLQNACAAGDTAAAAELLNLSFMGGGRNTDNTDNTDNNNGENDGGLSAFLGALLHNLSFSDINEEYIDDIAGEAKLTANVTVLDIKQFAADNPDLFAMPYNAGEKPADGEMPENGGMPDDGERQSVISEYAKMLAAYDKTTVKENMSLRFSYKDGRWELNGEMLLRTFLEDLQSVMPRPEGGGEGSPEDGESGGIGTDNAENGAE